MPETLDVVLVVDDTAVAAALKFLLEVEGMTVGLSDSQAATSADPSLARCRCIVVDNSTLTIQGIDLVEKLRARRIAAPVILLTSQSSAELRRRCARAGVRGLLQTPIMDRSLVDAVGLALADGGHA
jgi:two-component system, LuxR family, response regulator FixJ